MDVVNNLTKEYREGKQTIKLYYQNGQFMNAKITNDDSELNLTRFQYLTLVHLINAVEETRYTESGT